MIISINEASMSVLRAHLEAAFPNEACGFFFGKDGETREVFFVQPVPNKKEGDQRRRFEISALDYMKAERFAFDQDLDFLGVFHSHPNHPAIPSEHDLKQAVPYFSYLIVSVRDGLAEEVTSWRLDEKKGEFEKEEVLFVDFE